MEDTELEEKLKYEKEVSFQVDIYSHTAQFSNQLYKLQPATDHLDLFSSFCWECSLHMLFFFS